MRFDPRPGRPTPASRWRPLLGWTSVAVAALSLTACASEEADSATERAQSITPSSEPASAAESGPTADNPWVVTFEGWGPIKIFQTTADEVLAMPGWTKGHDRPYPELACAVNTESGAEVSLSNSDTPVLVSAILTPKGTLTDRGVGNESTPEQVKSAYAGESGITIVDLAGANGPGVMIMGPGESQLGFEFPAANGPKVNGSYTEGRCLPGAPSQ